MDTNSISSYPVQVCLCVNGRQNCEYKTKIYAEMQKGYLFNVFLIAVDQAYEPVNATIQGVLSSSQSNLLYGQVTKIPNKCTEANFQIISPHSAEKLTLFASDGPCNDAELSTVTVGVTFLPHTCPIRLSTASHASVSVTLNITVAIGTLNGLLFYANVLAANPVVLLLSYPESNFIMVFISWINLELGIDVCYIEGMDIYIKTWLQLAFPI